MLYLYPEQIDSNLIETVATTENILPYFDLPIQHINNDILKQMNRKTTAENIIEKINIIKEKIPTATIRTSLIAGFPGETDAQFEELLSFVKKTKFDRLGCFSYSKEEDTMAALLPNQISEKTKNLRTALIYSVSEKIIQQKALDEVSKTLEVVVDEKNENYYIARTEKDAPGVDCNVFFKSEKNLKSGDFVNVKITNAKNGDLYGKHLV